MHYISTRDADHAVMLGEAIARGIAPDGGLYVPQEFPHFTTRQFETDVELPQIAARLLAPFAAGDPLAAELPAICNEAFDFPAPLVARPARSRISVRGSSLLAWSASVATSDAS
jgi:threonine synthase